MEDLAGKVAFWLFVTGYVTAIIAAQAWLRPNGRIPPPRPPRARRVSLPIVLALSALFVLPVQAGDRQRVTTIPGTNFSVATAKLRRPSPEITEALLNAIQSWLAREFQLSRTAGMPRLQVVPARQLASMRIDAAAVNKAAAINTVPEVSDTVAIYSASERAILVSEEWTGTTRAGLSVLVHEMVHHIQYASGETYECPQQREALAYKAQDRWLAQFGSSLAKDFGIDGFSLLAKTKCFY